MCTDTCVKSWCMALGETSKQAGTKNNPPPPQRKYKPKPNSSTGTRKDRPICTGRAQPGGTRRRRENPGSALEVPPGHPAGREASRDRHLGGISGHIQAVRCWRSLRVSSLGAQGPQGIKASTLLVCTSSLRFSGMAQFREGSFPPSGGPHRESRW